ncbi:mitochondrial carrier domain-containing protein, partial [Gorgonomyces haynaldii]
MPQMSPFADATAGALGSAFANTVVFPLDVVKTRLQVQNSALKNVQPSLQYTSASDAIIKIYQAEGIPGLYSGLLTGLAGTVVSSFSYFYIYSTIRGQYERSLTKKEISTAMELLLGAAAGAISQLFVLPIGVVTTRQQTDPEVNKEGFFQVMSVIVKEEGLQGLWKGLNASLVLCVNPAITYGVFERLKSILLKSQNNAPLTSGQIFIIGAFSKTLATIVTYPYIMAKIRMQWKPPKDADALSPKTQEALKYKSSIDILKKVYQTDGFKGWYKGMRAQIVKAVFSQAILFVSKEKLTMYTILLFAALKSGKIE